MRLSQREEPTSINNRLFIMLFSFFIKKKKKKVPKISRYCPNFLQNLHLIQAKIFFCIMLESLLCTCFGIIIPLSSQQNKQGTHTMANSAESDEEQCHQDLNCLPICFKILTETIALDKVLFSTKSYWYFSYFSIKTYGYSLEASWQGTSIGYPQHVFMEK